MTDADYALWLESPFSRRLMLLELGVNSGGSETTRYVASEGWVSAATDTPASTYYDGVLAGGLTVQETLALDAGSATMSVGDITLNNAGGVLDSWLNDVWAHRSVAAYLGDPSWPKSDFRLVYSGTLEGLDVGSSQDQLVLHLADKMSRLEVAVTETKLTGTGPNADALLPLCFGEDHNVTPLLTNAGTLEYAVHNGPIESIIEVRDNGVPVSFTPNLSTGRFTLAASPVGTITASVQGDKPSGVYSNKIADIVQRLVTGFGRSDLRFTTSDLDTANFSAFNTANPQPVGLYLTDSQTVREAAEQLASSVGAKLVLGRTGLLRLVQVALPPGSSVATIDTDNAAGAQSLRVAQRLKVAAACKLAYCRNWTVQEGLQTGLVPQHKDLFAQEWMTKTASDSTVATLYKLPLDAEQETTLLLVGTDASTEATRRLNLRKVQRSVYEFQGKAGQSLLELGNGLTILSSRFGLSAGVAGQVVSLSMDWLAGNVTVEVLA